ncbi:MAG: hypothetical protein POH28_00535 [Acidocella sp.]|nr:hypothetical protein [Acidocella sp.]
MIDINITVRIDASSELLGVLRGLVDAAISSPAQKPAVYSPPAPLADADKLMMSAPDAKNKPPPAAEGQAKPYDDDNEGAPVEVILDVKPEAAPVTPWVKAEDGILKSSQTIVMPPADFFKISSHSPWTYERLLACYTMKSEGRTNLEIWAEINKMKDNFISTVHAVKLRFDKLRKQIAEYIKLKSSQEKSGSLPAFVTSSSKPAVINDALKSVVSPLIFPGVIWTDDRKIKLAQMRNVGERWDAIWKTLNCIPGAGPIKSVDSVRVQHAIMAKRGLIAKLLQPSPPHVPKVEQPSKALLVDASQARDWAGQRGLVTQSEKLDIEKVNAKRLALGLPSFEIRQPSGARR